MEQKEKVFADGFSHKRNENAHDFVIARLSIKIDDAISFISQNGKNGWINIDVKQARTGNFYCELDQFEPKKNDAEAPAQKSTPKPTQSEEEDDEDLPF